MSEFNDTLYKFESTKNEALNNFRHFIKKMSTHNPYDYRKEKTNYLLWNEQCLYNFPILYLASIYLYIYAKKNKCTVFLFASRDCCHWYKIFSKLFPNEIVHYFDVSRIMFQSCIEKGNRYYKNYIQDLIEPYGIQKTIYIDIHGTGKRCFTYFNKEFNNLPYCFMLSSKKSMVANTKKYCKKKKFITLATNVAGSTIEMLNYDLVGSLVNYNNFGPIRSKIEYDTKYVKPYHKCIEYMISCIDSLDVHSINKKYNIDTLHNFITFYITKMLTNKLKIFKCIKHKKKHEVKL